MHRAPAYRAGRVRLSVPGPIAYFPTGRRRRVPFARAPLAVAALLATLLVACGSSTSGSAPHRRVWRGPTETVASQGITTFERREIAQKVEFPTCLLVGPTAFRYTGVRPVPSGDVIPPGSFDTGYGLDRWRLLAPIGVLEEQPRLFVTARGSTGIVAEYARRTAGGC